MKAKSIHKIIAYAITLTLLTLALTPNIYGRSLNQPLTPEIFEVNDKKKDSPNLLPSSESMLQHPSLQRNNPVHLTLPLFPVNLTVQHTGPTSYFLSTLSDVPSGYDVTNGTYTGWCTDLDHTIQSNHLYPTTMYNSYNTTLPSHLSHQNWSKVNYILNNKQGTNWWQIQYALYFILDFGDQGLDADGWSMVNNATQYGSNYIPGLGDIVAVILDVGQNIQRTIIEVDIPEFNLTVTTVGNGSITIIPHQPSYLYGTIINITAIADPGWSFDSWSGDLTGTTNPTTITINTDKTVTATFTEDQYILTINTTGNGSVIKTPNQTTYTYGTIVNLTAIPDLGWSFDSWSGDLTGSTNPNTIQMNTDKTVTATFTQDQYILNITINGTGNVNIDPLQSTYTYGTLVTLNATACPWWHFSHWSGDLTGSTNPASIIMDGDKHITTHFEIDEYTLTVTIDGNGSVLKDPDQTVYIAGTIVNLTAVADEGWQFTEWTGDITGSNNPTYIVMDTNKSFTAHFTNEFFLEISIEGQGTVLKDPDQPAYLYGTTVELTAIPDTGWEFSHWEGNITGNTNPIELLINTDKAVTAIFTETPDTTPPNVTIITPENAIYLLGQKIIPFKFPLLFRGITVQVNATDDDTGIHRVEFYIDGQLVENDTEAPYEYNWKESDSFPIRHTIKAIAYDNAHNQAYDELDVWKWRFHPVVIAFFLLMAALLIRIGD